MSIKAIAVFCGSSFGANPIYKKDAEMLGKLIAEKNINLVFGGGNVGLMGAVSRAAVKNNGKVYGVIPKRIADMVESTEGIELSVVEDMHQRKAEMYSRADAFIVLPGGIGTLEEAMEVCTWNQLGYFTKPVCFLNSNNIYTNLISFLDNLSKEGFYKEQHLRQLKFAESAADALDYVTHFKPKYIKKL